MTVQHQPENERFVVTAEGHEAEVNYSIADGVMSITHTGVPEAIGGRGIAGALVRAALEHARAEGLRVVPACAYAEAWMRKHPEYDDLRQTA